MATVSTKKLRLMIKGGVFKFCLIRIYFIDLLQRTYPYHLKFDVAFFRTIISEFPQNF